MFSSRREPTSIPGLNRPGLIEAFTTPSIPETAGATSIPGLNRPGLIEARRTRRASKVNWRSVFPGLTARASLKQFIFDAREERILLRGIPGLNRPGLIEAVLDSADAKD